MHDIGCGGRDQKTIYIRMLGGFSITQGALSISDVSNRTRRLWNLLAYLIANRHKEVTKEELAAALWPGGAGENPVNALKNLVYRLRVVFEDHGFAFAKQMILHSGGGYRWNNRLPCVVDLERFEQSAQLLETADSGKLEALLEVLGLYRGDLLCGSVYQHWAQSRAQACRTIYLLGVHRACGLLAQADRLPEAEHLCERAVALAALEDTLHSLLIRLLLAQKKQEQALSHYNQTTDLFYRALGTPPSEELRGLYREITQFCNPIETDLGAIKGELQETGRALGAFYCDYEVFKDIYRVEARSASRCARPIFVGLLTVTDARGAVPEPARLAVIIDRLREMIRTSLRKGDVFCRFSAAQYMVMLPTHDLETGYMVLGRICKRFHRDTRCREMHLQAALQPLDPVGGGE